MSRLRVIRAVDAGRNPMAGHAPSRQELAAHLAERPDLVALLTGLQVAGPWERTKELGSTVKWGRRTVWDGRAIGMGELPCGPPEADPDWAARIGEAKDDITDLDWWGEAIGELLPDLGTETEALDAADRFLTRAGWTLQ